MLLTSSDNKAFMWFLWKGCVYVMEVFVHMIKKIFTPQCSPWLNNSESESHTLLTFGMQGDHLGQLFYSKDMPRANSTQILIISKDTASTIFLGNLFQYLNTITAEKLFIWMGFLYFSLCPLLPFLSVGRVPFPLYSPQKTLPTLPHQVFKHIEEILPSLLFLDRQCQFSQPLLLWQVIPFFNHLCGPSQDLFQFFHGSLVQRSPEEDTALQKWPHKFLVELHETITSQVQDFALPFALDC